MFCAFLYHAVFPNIQSQKWWSIMTGTFSRLTDVTTLLKGHYKSQVLEEKIVREQYSENKMFLCHCYYVVSRTVQNTVLFQSIVSLINIQWYWWTAMQLMTSSKWVHSLRAWHKNVLSSENTDKICMLCFINWNFEHAEKYLEALLKKQKFK